MKTLTFLVALLLLSVSLIAQDAPIPQDLPLQFRQSSDAVRRGVEQVIPQNLPLPRPTNNGGLLNRLRLPNRLAPAPDARVNAGTVEDRIAALEAKVAVLEAEIEAQRALIKQLEERLDQQKK
jgi:hypothetical protein